jgi:phosphatidylinositol-3-phosphatase
MPYFLTSWPAAVAPLAIAGSVLLSPPTLAQTPAPTLPIPDHIVVAIMENHSFSQIIDGDETPFIHDLARRGAVFTQSFGVTHPSQPNYFVLFSGSTHDVTDDDNHTIDAPTLASALKRGNKTFIGYVEDGSPRKHNPWESFRGSRGVERRFSEFPSDFTKLPTVSFVIPNEQNDMHDGTVEQGDTWLGRNLGRYAEWCLHHDSLFIVTFDEDDSQSENRIPTVFVGNSVAPGRYDRRIDHYSVVRTILAMYDLPPLARSASATPIADIWRGK